jgi:hypothetical protein
MEHKTKSVCESKLHGHRYNRVNAPSVLREELTFDGAQDKECSHRRERASAVREIKTTETAQGQREKRGDTIREDEGRKRCPVITLSPP